MIDPLACFKTEYTHVKDETNLAQTNSRTDYVIAYHAAPNVM